MSEEPQALKDPQQAGTLEKFLANIRDPSTWIKATAGVLVAAAASQVPGLLNSPPDNADTP